MRPGSFLQNISGEWIESLYDAWRSDSSSVPVEWHGFFSGFDLGDENIFSASLPFDETFAQKLSAVHLLIQRYRELGHLRACTDPLTLCRLNHPLLDLDAFGLEESDLELHFPIFSTLPEGDSLRTILERLKETYCHEIGVEFIHIQDPAERQWLIDRMEPCRNRPDMTPEEKLLILEKLHQAALFEEFLQRRFPAQKRFSLEGGDVLIPVLDRLVRASAETGISDIIMGMAHRGRLNVLAHIFGKPYENILAEFQESHGIGFDGDGDVKYHKGHSADIKLAEGRVIHLTIAANPSHLEAVNPVVEGKCRARQFKKGDNGFRTVLPLLIHGDASFSGQGSNMEVLNMSGLEGYGTGGTIHIVLNNQIGFTTLPRDARSTTYATDPAKMLACPIFHVQGDAPESALHTIQMALEYRQTFERDVVVEIICYRRHGHNEGDEPAFTQPLMYRRIAERQTVNRMYADQLAAEGIAPDLLASCEQLVRDRLDASTGKNVEIPPIGFKGQWENVSQELSESSVETAVPAEKLLTLARRIAELPPGFMPHVKVHALYQKRFEAVLKGFGIDWGNAETLGYASLLDEGIPVRLSGQDCRRGTFNHRHCVLHDIHDDSTAMPLATVCQGDALFHVWDSLLSEFGVLGFEYGYSLETPHGLTIWEAQFGDFANSAQVIIDQFIVSGETRWSRVSGLVMLLPHGYEGQGAEHSSARMERYLQLCAVNNITVASPTTPAQMFHLLRRQIKQKFRKPLVVFTPKGLLRDPRSVSRLDDLTSGSFHEIIPDRLSSDRISRVLLCTGRIYYDLIQERERQAREDVTILRVEQLYPFDVDAIKKILDGFSVASKNFWVQEEPENMGAWRHVQHHLTARGIALKYVGRPEACSPATGSHKRHFEEQMAVVRSAFGES